MKSTNAKANYVGRSTRWPARADRRDLGCKRRVRHRGAETFTVVGTATNDKFVDMVQGGYSHGDWVRVFKLPSVGDVAATVLTLKSEAGAPLGTARVQCVFHLNEWAICTGAFNFTGRGEIIGEGMVKIGSENPGFDVPITGGTGRLLERPWRSACSPSRARRDGHVHVASVILSITVGPAGPRRVAQGYEKEEIAWGAIGGHAAPGLSLALRPNDRPVMPSWEQGAGPSQPPRELPQGEDLGQRLAVSAPRARLQRCDCQRPHTAGSPCGAGSRCAECGRLESRLRVPGQEPQGVYLFPILPVRLPLPPAA